MAYVQSEVDAVLKVQTVSSGVRRSWFLMDETSEELAADRDAATV